MDDGFATGFLAGQDSGGGSNGGFMGGDGFWAIILLALLFGWGGNRGGFGGGGGSCGCSSPCATQADVRAAVDQQTLISKLDQQTYGLADSTYALNNTIVNGFHGVDNAICNLGYNIQSGFNTLGYNLKDCCCETQRMIERGFCDMGNAISTQTRDIIDNQNANYRGIMDFMVQSKMDALRSENESLRLRASQADQNAVIRAAIDASTAEIIRRTGNECPVPAYVVPNPNCCYGNPLGVGYNYGGNGYNGSSGCGCGCGCG